MGSKVKKKSEPALPSITNPSVKKAKQTPMQVVTRTMTIELAEPKKKVQELDRIRMDVRPLSKLQRQGLVNLTSSLLEGDFYLQNGTKVARQSHAIKWVLEKFGEYAEK